jgi:hypothetical protein
VRATQDGESDYVDVLLDRGRGDHLRGLVQTRVDDFHPRIPKRGGNYLRAAIVSIKSGLGDENSNWSHRDIKLAAATRARQSGLRGVVGQLRAPCFMRWYGRSIWRRVRSGLPPFPLSSKSQRLTLDK